MAKPGKRCRPASKSTLANPPADGAQPSGPAPGPGTNPAPGSGPNPAPTQGLATTSDSTSVPIALSNVPRTRPSYRTSWSANPATAGDPVVTTDQIAPPSTMSAGGSGADPANAAMNAPGAPTLQDLRDRIACRDATIATLRA